MLLERNIIITVVLLWQFLLCCSHFCQCCQSHVVQHIWFHHSSVCSTYTNMQAVCLSVCLSHHFMLLHQDFTPEVSPSQKCHTLDSYGTNSKVQEGSKMSHRTLFFWDVTLPLLVVDYPLTQDHIPGEWTPQPYCGRNFKTRSLDLS